MGKTTNSQPTAHTFCRQAAKSLSAVRFFPDEIRPFINEFSFSSALFMAEGMKYEYENQGNMKLTIDFVIDKLTDALDGFGTHLMEKMNIYHLYFLTDQFSVGNMLFAMGIVAERSIISGKDVILSLNLNSKTFLAIYQDSLNFLGKNGIYFFEDDSANGQNHYNVYTEKLHRDYVSVNQMIELIKETSSAVPPIMDEFRRVSIYTIKYLRTSAGDFLSPFPFDMTGDVIDAFTNLFENPANANLFLLRKMIRPNADNARYADRPKPNRPYLP